MRVAAAAAVDEEAKRDLQGTKKCDMYTAAARHTTMGSSHDPLPFSLNIGTNHHR